MKAMTIMFMAIMMTFTTVSGVFDEGQVMNYIQETTDQAFEIAGGNLNGSEVEYPYEYICNEIHKNDDGTYSWIVLSYADGGHSFMGTFHEHETVMTYDQLLELKGTVTGYLSEAKAIEK